MLESINVEEKKKGDFMELGYSRSIEGGIKSDKKFQENCLVGKMRIQINKLHFMYTNIRSLMNNNKMEEIEILLRERSIDVLGVTESWTHEGITNAEINIQGFSLFRRDRSEQDKCRGGGVLLYIREALLPELKEVSADSETLWVNIKGVKLNEITVGICYRRPDASEEMTTRLIKSIQDNISKQTLIMGDFNFRDLVWEEDSTSGGGMREDFQEMMSDLFLTQHVKEPTRGSNILDLVISTEAEMVEDLTVAVPVSNSDHNTLYWDVVCDVARQERKDQHYNYKQGNYKGIVEEMQEVDWKTEFKDMDVEERWGRFKVEFLGCRNRHVKKCKERRNQDKVWINEKIRKQIRKRNRNWGKLSKIVSHENLAKYKRARNITTMMIRNAKKNHEMKLANRIKEEPKQFYAYVNAKRKTKDSIGPLRDDKGQMIREDGLMGNMLNSYFGAVFTKEDEMELEEVENKFAENELERSYVLENIEMTEDKIEKAIDKLKSNKAAGVDDMGSTLLKMSKEGIVYPLYEIFSASFSAGIVPKDWKKANVTPIFKKGSKRECGNYRPVSLTCQAGKLMERIIKDELVKFIENGIITDSQHGFRSRKSCLTNMLEFLETVQTEVDQGEPIDVVFLDLQKAFDKVPHGRLGIKLRSIGVRGKLLVWIMEWLKGRTQRVVLNGEASEWVDVESGVPQGSVLGPVLFIVYINDMDERILNSLWKFADDTKMVGRVRTKEELERFREDLSRLSEWAEEWKMPFNVTKCKVMHFGKNNCREEWSMGDIKLEVIKEEKDLGVVLSDDLKVGVQCKKAAIKGNQILGMIYRTFENKDLITVKILYKALVRPHLDYCSQAWRPHLQKDKDVLERVQRRATRMVSGFKDIPYEERLRRMNLTTLETRRLRADLLEVYKIMTGREGVRENLLFTRIGEESVTRGHSLKLLKKRFYTDLGKYSFGNRVVSDWNQLPASVVQAPSVNIFKTQIDNYLGRTRGLDKL
jgi:ribonucleases P/MRP protein subunit RPP40